MSFGSYSTTPASNVSIGSISIAEGCPAGNVNDALRQLAADGRELYNTVASISVSTYMPLAGGYFTAPVYRAGAGAFLYHAGSTLTSGAIYVQPLSSALPSPAEGTIVFQY